MYCWSWWNNGARIVPEKKNKSKKLHGPTEIAMHTLIECTKTMFKTWVWWKMKRCGRFLDDKNQMPIRNGKTLAKNQQRLMKSKKGAHHQKKRTSSFVAIFSNKK